jgi:ribosomal protein S18 acetylase RimI-like enzyme
VPGSAGGGTIGKVEIRPARISDAPGIALVHVRSWQGAYRGLLPQQFLDAFDPAQRAGFWERILAAAQERSGVVVADGGESLLGFACFGPARDEDADPGRTGEILAIYLLPDVWGQGWGRQLMAAAVTGLAGAGFSQAVLWVLDTNERARRFYQAAGWSRDGAAKPDTIGGTEVTEVRYRRPLP